MLLGRILPQPLPGERIVFLLRRYWITFARQLTFYLLLAVLPFIARYLVLRLYPGLVDTIFSGGILEALFRLGVSLYFLVVWVFFWSAWVDYYLDVWVVTTERVVTLEQRALFNRSVSELRLLRVQDVSAKVQGFLGTFLDYGEVRLETAGEQSEAVFAFHQVPHPTQVSEKILHLADDCRHLHSNDGGT